jgi:putative acetyltransferase
MALRLEDTHDRQAIDAICEAAFGGTSEAGLVRSLERDGDLILSVLAYDREPVGHIAYSPLTLEQTPLVRACALAPLAVLPAFQKQGLGTALVRHSLQRLTDAGYDLVVVLGEPFYYGRFGFDPALAARLKTPYDGPYLQALALSDAGRGAHGPARYARAFAELT